MKYITLDFSGIKTQDQLYDYFETVFELPDYFGRNMDALWDCLLFWYDSETTILLKNVSALPKNLNWLTEIMLTLFDDLQKEDENVTVQILSSNIDESNDAYLI